MLKQVIGLFAYTEKKKKFQFHHFNTKNKVKIVQNCCVNYPLFFLAFSYVRLFFFENWTLSKKQRFSLFN